ncbi:RidA family protein [Peribacillus sp. SCS-37]|uniref:RidA family protein n=1 Tax=Paraperibacillus esterisolvens TaxID=3115296 RepID=UPI00390584CB
MSESKSFHNPENLAAVDYPYASRIPAGMDLLFLAGSCPLDKEGRVPYPNDYAEQAKLCVENIKTVLAESGGTLKSVVYTRILVASTNRKDLVTVWRAVRDALGDHNTPSTLTGVTVLGYEDQLVEIEAVAAVNQG